MRVKKEFANHKEELLTGVYSSGSSPCVVLLHGFTAYKDLGVIADLFEELRSSGQEVFCFDFSGNGESEGAFEESTFSKQAKEVTDAITFLQDRFGVKEVVLCGHSMGGTAALLAASDSRVRAVVCLAAPSQPAKRVEQRKDRFFVGNTFSVPRVQGVRLPKREYAISEQWMADAKRVHPLVACPQNKRVVAIHGSNDSLVPLSDSQALVDRGAERVVLETDHFFSGCASHIVGVLREL